MTTWQTLKPQLQAALVDAFNEAAFEQMLAYRCDKKLDNLAADKIPFPQKVFEVIKVTESEGWLDRLVRGAREANRDHTALQAVTGQVLAGIEAEGQAFYQLSYKHLPLLSAEDTPGESATPDAPYLAHEVALPSPPLDVSIPYVVKDSSPLNWDWCWIPPSSFQMGSEQCANERPIHDVYLNGFWLTRHPIINKQYQLFIEAGGYSEQKWWTPEAWQVREKNNWTEPQYWKDSKFSGAQQPVVGVSWYEAVAFCAWAAEVMRKKVRLPTEAEWEKAARGVDGLAYPWGMMKPNRELCHFQQNWFEGAAKSIGQFSPQGDSPYGCADMAGNVWDWTGNWYQAYLDNSHLDTAYGEKGRVVKGGAWHSHSRGLRCALRAWELPGQREKGVGFRCVIDSLCDTGGS